jgi:phage terminase large subunit GpA-like protein
MREWIEAELVIPTGTYAGEKFRFARQPITRLWVDEIDSGRWTEFVYSGPSQSGKSLIGYVAPLLYHAAELGERLIFGVPLDEMAVDKWESDIRPAMEASPRMRRLLPRRGPGSAGGTIRDRVSLTNGAVLKIMASGGSDQSKAGYTARIVCVTEAAGFSEAGNKSEEADPLRQLRARQRSFTRMDRRLFIEGTKTIETHLPCTLRESSSDSKIVVPCPHCGQFVGFSRENLVGWKDAKTEIEAADKAAWQCPSCAELLDDDERYSALCDSKLLHRGQQIDKRGQVTGEQPETTRLWFDYNAFHNAFLTAGDIAVDCWSAEQIEPETAERERAEKQLSQFVFGEAYRPPAFVESELLVPELVSERRLELPRGVAPADTTRLVLGADVGERVCHWVLVALRECQALHICDYGTIDVPVRQWSIRSAISRAITDLVDQLAVGVVGDGDRGRIPLAAAYVDSGHEPDAIFDAGRAILASRGGSIDFMPVLGRGESQLQKRKYTHPAKTGNVIRQVDKAGRWHVLRVRRANINQLTLDADAMKILVQSGLRIPLDSPGSISLFAGPAAVHRRFAKHLTSEQLVREEQPGAAPRQRWEKSGANHFLDSLVYGAVAALRWNWAPESREPAQTRQATWQGD